VSADSATWTQVRHRRLLEGVLETCQQQGGKDLKEVFLHANPQIDNEEFKGNARSVSGRCDSQVGHCDGHGRCRLPCWGFYGFTVGGWVSDAQDRAALLIRPTRRAPPRKSNFAVAHFASADRRGPCLVETRGGGTQDQPSGSVPDNLSPEAWRE
jgi:hypothetical protein